MSSKSVRRVVVVDDDSSMRQALARILRLAGYSATTFTSAEELLQTDAAAAADCLVLDIYLPGLTGIELYERLARAAICPPVIFISAYEEPNLAPMRALGAVTFLGKPFPGNKLLDEIARALSAPQSNPRPDPSP